MDDLSADLRPIVHAARAPRLTRAEKSRMWQRLEDAVDEGPSVAAKPGRRFMAPWLLAAALPLAGLLGYVVGAERAEPVAGNHATQSAPAERATNVVQAPTSTAVPGSPGERPLAKAQLKASKARGTARPKRRTTASTFEVAVAAHTESAELRAVVPSTLRDAALHAPATASNTSAGAEHSESLSSVNSGLTAGEPNAEVRRIATTSPAARAAAFRAKLEEESRARYQAALAQHARSASIRRPLSSVAGYGAW